ncbi:hypothetical protein AB0O91_00820 [Kitasatospora sp. NPDC089797]|uniref:hypothetical protein n=1 Tax=Kitasatospora sp. NPDC089797 TaxID=3155298 RepID=UPI00343FF263
MVAVDGSNMAHAVIGTAVKERTRLQTGRSRTTALVVLVLLAGVGLFLALVVGKSDPTSAPTCDGKTMTRSDECRIWSNHGGGGTFGYDEMIDRRESGKGVWQVVGFGAAGLAVVLMGVSITKLDPKRPWGKPVVAVCPQCHQPTLREKLTVHTISRGRTNYRYSGIVTLCTPVCGFTAVRQR